MKFDTKKFSVDTLHKDIDSGACVFDSYYQRKSKQWSEFQKSCLIDSIVRNFPIPPVYGTEVGDKYNVMDGCQRLTTINDFINGEFKITSAFPNTIELGENETEILSGKSFDKLNKKLQERILRFQIDTVVISDVTKSEEAEIFRRLNGGTPLTKAQQLRSIMSERHTRQLSELAEHDAFSKANITEKQRLRDEDFMIVARCLMLITADEKHPVTGFGATQVKKFLDEYELRYNEEVVSGLDKDLDILLELLAPAEKAVITKVVIPPIIFVIDMARKDDTKLERFKNVFSEFVASGDKALAKCKEFGVRHTTSAESINNIKDFFLDMVK